MGIRHPDHFLIHVHGAIHAIKEMELDTKFQQAMKAVESLTLEVNLAKITYKDELKKGERDDTPNMQLELARLLPTSPKSSKRQRVMNPLKLQSLQLRQHSAKPKRQGMRCRMSRCAWCADFPALWKSAQ